MSVELSTSAIIETAGDFLLVEEGEYPGIFNLPGGGPKKREQLDDCVVRETREESGLVVVPNYIVGIYQCPRTAAGNNLTRIVFACSVIGGERTPSAKHPQVEDFPYEQIKKLDEEGLLRNNGVLQSIKDYRRGRGVGLSMITYLSKEKKHKQ